MEQNCGPLPADQSRGLGCAIGCLCLFLALMLVAPVLMALFVELTATVECNAMIILRFAEEPADESERDFQNDRSAQQSLIKSAIVLRPALKKPGIAQLNCLKNQKDKERWLSDHLNVRLTGDDSLTISISGPEKDELVEILTAVRDAYMEEIVQVERDLDVVKRDELSREYQNLGNALPNMEIECQDLEKANAAGEETPDLERLREDLTRKKAEYEQMGVELAELNRKLEAEPRVKSNREPWVQMRKKSVVWFLN